MSSEKLLLCTKHCLTCRETSDAALLREQSMLAAHSTALVNHKKHLGPGTIVGAAMSAGVALVMATFFGTRSAAR
jgi:hypothetical protein